MSIIFSFLFLCLLVLNKKYFTWKTSSVLCLWSLRLWALWDHAFLSSFHNPLGAPSSDQFKLRWSPARTQKHKFLGSIWIDITKSGYFFYETLTESSYLISLCNTNIFSWSVSVSFTLFWCIFFILEENWRITCKYVYF